MPSVGRSGVRQCRVLQHGLGVRVVAVENTTLAISPRRSHHGVLGPRSLEYYRENTVWLIDGGRYRIFRLFNETYR